MVTIKFNALYLIVGTLIGLVAWDAIFNEQYLYGFVLGAVSFFIQVHAYDTNDER